VQVSSSIRIIQHRTLRRSGYVAARREARNVYRIFVRIPTAREAERITLGNIL
jgi:hypothetical protein